MADIPEQRSKQLLHLVFGGELNNLTSMEFKDLNKLDIVGIYPNYASAYVAWKEKAQRTVDNAEMRYFIVHLHRLLDPNTARRSTKRKWMGRNRAFEPGQSRSILALTPKAARSTSHAPWSIMRA